MSGEDAGIENLLRSHPGTREAAVFRDGEGVLRAFIVPDDHYLDEALGREAASEFALKKWRKTSDLSQFAKGAEAAPIGFNTLGWNSSYTRRPIPEEDMREWLEMNVEEVLRLSPQSVYEAGCGTGMLALRIAPRCTRYVATDFAPTVISRFRAQLECFPDLHGRVEIEERLADDFDGLERNAFDTFVLNSVSQNFPGLPYLTKVIKGALGVVRPGGRMFIGDVRSLPLLPLFACSVELYQAADDTSLDELRVRISRRIEKEWQLVVSPAYFLSLGRLFPEISQVDIMPLRGRATNEMTRFRYQAIIHIGAQNRTRIDADFVDWTESRWTLKAISSIARSQPNKVIGIKRIKNARLEQDVLALTRLESATPGLTSGQFRREIRALVPEGIAPQSLLELQQSIDGSAIFLSWAACRDDGSYDAAIVPLSVLDGAGRPELNWPEPNGREFVRLATTPGQQSARNELVDRLRIHCNEGRPEGEESFVIELADTLPRRADGGIDHLALSRAVSKSFG